MATRHPEKYDAKLAGFVQFGASPRATIALDKCAKINAWLDKRDFVTLAVKACPKKKQRAEDGKAEKINRKVLQA